MEGGARSDFTAGGFIVSHGSLEPCTVFYEAGKVSLEEGSTDRCDFRAVFVRDMVNAHTHCGDYGLKIPAGLSLEELVAPPDGLKHRYLRSLGEEGLRDNIARFSESSAGFGSASFIDFREGGLEGCIAARMCAPDAIILGRPTSGEYDPDEVAGILEASDGIGISGLSDMSRSYIEALADDVRDAGKILAIHVSERVRDDIDFALSLDPAFVVHMCEATDDDLSKCAEAEVPIAVCPTSNAYFGKEAPVARMIACGADIAVGTDNGMICEPDLISEMSLLARIVKRQGGDIEHVWSSLSRMSKILYRAKSMESQLDGAYLTVVPIGDSNHVCPEGLSGGNAFRVAIK